MFNTQTTYATGTLPRTVVARDFNGDTIPDLVVVNQSSNNVSVLFGDGAGSFNPQTTYAVGSTPWFVAAEDFNGDSNLDLAVIQNIPGNSIVSILPGDGSGSFNSQTTYSVGYYPQVIAVEDFNVDGNLDLVVLVSSAVGDNISIFLGDGSGGFGPETTYAVGSGLTAVAVEDFNGDTIPDLALTNQSSNSVSIVLGDGFGSFGVETTYAVGSTPWSVAAEDFNGDGQLDLAVANQSSNNVSILLGDGSGGFNPQTTYAVDSGPRTVAIGDFNADGNKDLVTANSFSGNVSILLGDGSGGFNPQTTYAVGSFPTSVAVEDFNGDGQLDLGVTNFGGNSVSILLNTPGVSITPGTTPTEAGPVNGTFNITLDRPTPAGGLTVNFDLTGSTATATDDYELTALTNVTAVGTNTFTIDEGVTTATLNLVPVDDSIDDEAETVIINLATGIGYIPDTTSNTATLTITDDDTAGITVTPLSLTTTEAGGTATFTVVLDTQPTADVTINLSSDNTAEGTIDLSTLTFTSLNWNTAQTVTVTGVNDNIDDGDIAYNIVTTASSTDTTYNGFNVPDVAVTNTDDDTGGGVSITPTSINVTEGGATASYDIVLTIAPTAPVTINFTPDSQISPIQPINFDGSNWNVPQTVTVSAVDDGVVEGLHTGSITHSAVSTDTGYNGIVIDAVTASITDNDTVGVSVMQPVNRTDVIEGDSSDMFKLVLNTQPTADVTVAITTDTQTTTDVQNFIFTPTNWNLPQTVTVTAVDDTVVEGLHSSTISFAAASADGFYNGLTIAPLAVNVSDNDRDSTAINLPAAAFQQFGAGDDVINASAASDVVYGGAGNDIINGGVGDDFVYGQLGDDIIDGGDGQDFIWAGAGNDHVKGAGGNDVIFAGDGSDRITGGAGNDELFGDAGNDHLYGDAGADTLTGGLGRDAFAIGNDTGGTTTATADIITDFTLGEDVIDLIYPLGFADISITQNGADTVIQTRQLTGEYLAVLLGITAVDIGASDFS